MTESKTRSLRGGRAIAAEAKGSRSEGHDGMRAMTE